MRLPSGSRTALALACQWPWQAEAQPWPADPPGAAAERGTRIHAAVAMRLDDRAPAVEVVDDEHDAADIIADAIARLMSAHAAAPMTLATEAAYAWHPERDEAVLLGVHIGRAYGEAPPGSYCCSADVVWTSDGVVHVYDVKTGRAEHVESARENAQLATLALAASRAHGCSRAVVGLVFEDGRVDAHELDALDLDAHAERLRDLARGIDAQRAQPAPGTHCGYCPARSVCPTTREAVAETLPALAQAVGMLDPITSPEDAAARIVKLRMVKDAWETAEAGVDALLRAYAAERGAIPLGNGKVRKLVEASRETFAWTAEDKDKARAEGRVKNTTYTTWKDVRA